MMNCPHIQSMENEKRSRKLLRLLAGKQALIEHSSKADVFLLVIVGERKIKCQRSIIAHWLANEFVLLKSRDGTRSTNNIVVTELGLAFLKRSERGNFADQHREIESQNIEIAGIRQKADRNINESPLSGLFQRKSNRDSWLDVYQFDAGERLRSDFEFSQLAPKITASWDPVANPKIHRGSKTSDENLTDRVLGARQRLNQAIEAVGPEFSSILLDVCCFLKGMEQIERERQWPRRSAKLLLRAALSALARHYNPGARMEPASNIKHWAAPDYRPKI